MTMMTTIVALSVEPLRHQNALKPAKTLRNLPSEHATRIETIEIIDKQVK